MKILLITNEFPNPYDPHKAVFNLSMVRALTRQHEVKVVSPIPWTDEWLAGKKTKTRVKRDRCEIVNGIEVHYPRYFYPPRILRNQYAWFYVASIRSTLNRLTDSYKPDAVLSYWAYPDGEVATRAARQMGVPSIVMAAGSDVLDGNRRRCVVQALRGADAVVTVSQHLEREILKLGVDASKIHIWQRGVDDYFTPGDRAESRRLLGIPADLPVLLWVGRMVPVKGLDVLMNAYAKLREGSSAFRAYLIGEGPLRATLEVERNARGLQEAVHFVGSCAHEHLPDWFRAANLTVLTSRSEGMPNVLRESLACGTPFVATNVGGIAELTSEHPDWLVEPGNANALAEAITRSLSKGATSVMSNTTRWPQAAEALIRIIHQVRPMPNDVPLVCELT